MAIRLSENFRALFYAPFYAAHAIGAYRTEGVDVTLLPSSDPARTAAALRAGEVDVMWGGPLRVIADARAGPRGRHRVLLRRDCARSVLRHRPRAAAGLPARRSCGHAVRLGRRGADAVAVPAGRSAPRRHRSGDAGSHQRPDHGGERRGAARRRARRGATVPALRRGTLLASGAGPSLVCRRRARPHRLHGAGHAPSAARRAARRIAGDDARDGTHAALDGGDAGQRHRPCAGANSSPTLAPDIFAASIDRYRALGLFAPIRCCSARASSGCRRRCAPAAHWTRDIAFEACVDNSLARAGDCRCTACRLSLRDHMPAGISRRNATEAFDESTGTDRGRRRGADRRRGACRRASRAG